MKKANDKQIFLNIVLIVLCVIVIAPMVLLVSVSISNEADIAQNGYAFIPRKIDFTAYKYVFQNPDTILQAYKVTAFYSVTSMVFAVLFMSMMAYMLSVKILKGRSVIALMLYFTNLFGGGMVANYLVYTQLYGMGDTIWMYIIPGLISPWYVFMIRTSMQAIPEEISESAFIDGASEYRIFFQMIIPLSKPVLATIALFTFLGKWNDWNTSMIYIHNPKLMSLQYQLQRILHDINAMQEAEQSGMGQAVDLSKIPTETVRMAMAVVVAGPALLVFPFFQKYFTKGLTVGSVKG